jgi:class 3 adenylate cyclase/tetratricopeptide (TPR) repeat protein
VAERRWASVLFADLVGFTTLSESRDPEQVRELLSGYFDRCRQIIASYDGVVEKFIGDAVMAVWGVPTAHEDDAERAVRAGVDLVAMVAALGAELGVDLALRVGVVTGEVAATLGATSQGMVAGDPVNTAARVQAAAEPGHVLVDSFTRSLTEAVVAYDDTGDHALKGKVEAMRLYAVSELRSVPAVASSVQTRMIGRDRELTLLQELYGMVVEQGRPRLVVVDGEPGVGKSRLVAEFEGWLDSLPARTMRHRGRCLSYGRGVAFRALAESVRNRLGIVDTQSSTEAVARVDAWVAEHASRPDDSQVRGCVSLLLDLPGEFPDYGPGELFAGWVRFFELVGSGLPVVLVLDDCHHADDGLLDFVDFALQTCRTPLLIMALARPELLERRPGWGGRRTTVIPIGPLDHLAMTALVADLVGDLNAADRDDLVRRAGGVPLFAIETVRSIVDTGIARVLEGKVLLDRRADQPLAAMHAPASLRSLVRSRLDTLPEAGRRLVADASVLGLSFALDALEALSRAGAALEDDLAVLVRREILVVDDDPFSAAQEQYRFVHAVVRQVAYDTLSRRDRKQRHLAAARYIAGSNVDAPDLDALVAQHLVDAYDACFAEDPDRTSIAAEAVEHLDRAGHRSESLGSARQAWYLVRQASDLCTDRRTAALLRARAGRLAGTAGHFESGTELSRTAYDDLVVIGSLADVGQALAAYLLNLRWAQEHQQVLEAGRPWVERLLADADAREDGLLVLEEMYFAAFNLGDTDEGIALAERAIAMGTQGVDEVRVFRTEMLSAELALMRRDEPRAEHHYERAIDAAPRHGVEPVSSAYMLLAMLRQPDDGEAALASVVQATREARRRGTYVSEEWGYVGQLEVLFNLGRFHEMAALLSTLDPDAIVGAPRPQLAAWVAFHGWAAGLPVQPWPLDQPQDGYLGQLGDALSTAAVSLWRGDLAAAGEPGERSLTLMLARESRSVVLSLVPLWSAMAGASRRTSTAEKLLAIVDEAQPRRRPVEHAFCSFARGYLEPLVRRGDGLQILRSSVYELDEVGAPGYAVLARLELAERLGPEHPDSERLRTDAAAAAARIGAHGWIPAETAPPT